MQTGSVYSVYWMAQKSCVFYHFQYITYYWLPLSILKRAFLVCSLLTFFFFWYLWTAMNLPSNMWHEVYQCLIQEYRALKQKWQQIRSLFYSELLVPGKRREQTLLGTKIHPEILDNLINWFKYMPWKLQLSNCKSSILPMCLKIVDLIGYNFTRQIDL